MVCMRKLVVGLCRHLSQQEGRQRKDSQEGTNKLPGWQVIFLIQKDQTLAKQSLTYLSSIELCWTAANNKANSPRRDTNNNLALFSLLPLVVQPFCSTMLGLAWLGPSLKQLEPLYSVRILIAVHASKLLGNHWQQTCKFGRLRLEFSAVGVGGASSSDWAPLLEPALLSKPLERSHWASWLLPSESHSLAVFPYLGQL